MNLGGQFPAEFSRAGALITLLEEAPTPSETNERCQFADDRCIQVREFTLIRRDAVGIHRDLHDKSLSAYIGETNSCIMG